MPKENYLELYKRHLPRRWDDLIGQTKVVASLKSAVKASKLPVAYLFSGPRGTGKTSAAKVLASAINCLNEDAQKRGDACGECEVCTNVIANKQIGVFYESMANRGGVDDVRKLVDRARLAQPVKRAVWILDEVHNLSAAAWDALLIPLESTSMPALFVLCSTESHKIPEPILSRVQARKFNLVPMDILTAHLSRLAEEDELDADEEIIIAAARKARGSVRDALTALEELLSTQDVDKNYSELLILALQDMKVLEAMKVIQDYTKNSNEKIRYLAEDIYVDLRDLLLLRTKGGEKLVDGSPVEDLEAFKAAVDANSHLNLLEIIGDATTAMSVGAADHRVILETAILKYIRSAKRAKRGGASK